MADALLEDTSRLATPTLQVRLLRLCYLSPLLFYAMSLLGLYITPLWTFPIDSVSLQMGHPSSATLIRGGGRGRPSKEAVRSATRSGCPADRC